MRIWVFSRSNDLRQFEAEDIGLGMVRTFKGRQVYSLEGPEPSAWLDFDDARRAAIKIMEGKLQYHIDREDYARRVIFELMHREKRDG